MTAQLVIDAFQMAWQRGPPAGSLLFYSDRGSLYTSHVFQQLLRQYDVLTKMIGTDNCSDNTMVEGFFGCLKKELILRASYLTRTEPMMDIFLYIKNFYNRRRRYSIAG